jgi:antitoxin component YwqK of YwqJK toxin-antitoxin module
VSYIKNDTLHGLFKNYDEGFLSYTCYYNKGLLNGPLTFYRPDGSVSQVRMFYNGYPHKEITYDRAGNKNYEGNYLESVVSDFYMYENGEKIDSVDLKYFTGNTKYRVRGLESIEREVKNAVSNGKYFLRYSDGFTEIEKNFINDDLHGEYIFNAPTGEYLFKQSYVYGNKDGKAEWFTPNGVITYRCYYKNDEQNGKSTRFYANGNAYRTANHKNDKQQGNKIFYSPTGDTLLIMNMKDDLITSYQSRNDQGNLGETVVCGNGKEALSIKYENGKPALNIIINKKYIDGKLEIFSREGQLLVEKNRKNGHLDGIHSLYYDNGKMLFERIYKQNQLEGISLYFNENGEKEVEIESEMDMNHGSYKIYENGKLKKTLTYEADTCIAIE